VADAKTCLIDGGFTEEEQLEMFGQADLSSPELLERVNEATIANALKRRQDKLQAISVGKAVRHVESYANARMADSTATDPVKVEAAKGRATRAAVNSILVRDVRETAGNVSVEAVRDAYTGKAHSMMADFFERYRPKKAGFSRDKAGLRNLVREIMGEATGDADAAAISKQWLRTSEWLRKQFNANGGNIRNLDDWALPQSHDAYAVSKVGFDEWYNYITPRLDRNRMGDIPEAEFREMMEYTYNAIRTEGVSTIDLTAARPTVPGLGKMANRYQDARFLHFKDAENWLEYQERFGSQNIAATITDHIERMARDVAIMKVLGPNPNQTVQYLAAMASKSGGNMKYGNDSLKIWNNIKGFEAPENPTLGNVFGSVRNVQTFSKLGMAWISSWTDPMFAKMTANYNGFAGRHVMSRMKGLTDAETRRFATTLGIIADYGVDRALQSHRFGEVSGHGLTRQMADQTLRLSLLTPWTNATKQAFHMEFLHFLAQQSTKSIDEVAPELQRTFKTYGITSKDWDAIRHSQKEVLRGERFINPASLDDMDLTAKFNGMIYSERQLAVPEGDARVRALLNQGMAPGTWGGELIRSALQFKTFPVSMMMTHFGRMALAQNNTNRLAYGAQLFIGTTLLGGVAYQAEEIAKGRDPMNPADDPAKFFGAAALQGGGIGIFGDFLFADQTRFGRSFAETVAGPSAQLVDDFILDGIVGNTQKMAFDDKSFGETFGKTAVDTLNYLPYQVFYNRLGFERGVKDQLGRLTNPKWDANKRKAMRRKRKETGQQYWWKPGSVTPERAPEL